MAKQPAKRDDYLPSFYFRLNFKGQAIDFQEVSGISKEFGIEEFGGGGENRFKYRLPTTVKSPNLVLKRAIVQKESELSKWCTSLLDGGLANSVNIQDVSVCLMNATGKTSIAWVFHNAYPIKYAFSDLKSEDNKLLIETMELAYTYFDIFPKDSKKK